MDLLWSPWRYDYITKDIANSAADPCDCVFCRILESSAGDKEKFILHRAEHNFVILNIYPYITGHLMIVPYEHLANFDELSTPVSNELTEITKRCQSILREVYRPDGFNIGMNLGKAAGAGVAGHLHQHILPRWSGDSNFMTSIAQTRTIPEALTMTFEKLSSRF
ncbi:MAG TPA: HIT domain-containing protein [Pyrinomonadaceae bacterium]|nr:HIT domain-containing protein [Pyrinomonadaceae bacterium]